MKPILIIDAGHGGRDFGGGTNQYFKEKDMALKISLYQYERFKELGVEVSLTRKNDVYLNPQSRADIVKNSGAKYCISNHINAFNKQARGVETIHSIYASEALAKKIYKAIFNAVEGTVARRVFSKEGKNGDYYYMHRLTGSVQTTIIEYAFADNEKDTELLMNHWKYYAESVVKAFCEHIGHEYKAPNKKVEEKEGEYPLSVEEANKQIKLLSAVYEFVKDVGGLEGIHEAANELRRLSGQKTT